MKKKTFFITGISTDVGKTVVSAIVTEALQADYWKPIQSGDLDFCDTKRVAKLLSNTHSIYHPNAYALTTPMSPHASAKIDNTVIDLSHITVPKTDNHLVIEGAGGIMVPLNSSNTILDLIQPEYKVIVVSRHYLGSINHTLLTVNTLKQKGFDVSIIFSGNPLKSTEDIVSKLSDIPILGRVNEEPYFDKNVIKEYAGLFKDELLGM